MLKKTSFLKVGFLSPIWLRSTEIEVGTEIERKPLQQQWGVYFCEGSASVKASLIILNFYYQKNIFIQFLPSETFRLSFHLSLISLFVCYNNNI